MNLRSRGPAKTERSMPSTLKIADLHESYQTASTEDAIAMANLGAVCWQACKAGLYEQWSTSMEGDESAKAEVWRSEGKQAMLESVKTKLASAEEAIARAAAAEGLVQQLRSSVEAEVARRMADAQEGYRKDYEIAKMAEISGLKERIAMSEGKGEYVQMLSEAHTAMREKIASLEAQLAQQVVANTKSSHAIGKAGEATVLDMLENTVCKAFTHSSVKDMTGTSHVADFHLRVMGSSGNKIKILIDSKKYKRPVNSDEINKLYGDMDADEECNCGIMISITSGICTKNQFSISRTPHQKPVLFLTFQDLPTENQKDILCWGIQVLSELLGETNTEVQQEMLNNLEQFLDRMTVSVKDIEGIIRSQLKVVESMREVRGKMLKDLTLFRAGGVDDDSSDDKGKVGCVAILKKTGFPCGSLVVEGSEKCRHHMPRVEKK
jgi:hypothetical protein